MKKFLFFAFLLIFIPIISQAQRYYLPVPVENSGGTPIRNAVVVAYPTGTTSNGITLTYETGTKYYTTSLPDNAAYDIYQNGIPYMSNVWWPTSENVVANNSLNSDKFDAATLATFQSGMWAVDTTVMKILSVDSVGTVVYLLEIASGAGTGSGDFVYKASGYSSDGGNVFPVSGGGYFVRKQFLDDGKYFVTSYGARGDSTYNNLSAFTKAIASANTNGGGLVVVPDGDFFTNTAIPVLSNVKILGNSPNSHVYVASDISVFSVADQNNIEFEGLTITGNNAIWSDSYNDAIYVNGSGSGAPCENITITKCRFERFKYAVRTSDTKNLKVLNNTFISNQGAIQPHQSVNGDFSHNYIDATLLDGGYGQVGIHVISDSMVSSNNIVNYNTIHNTDQESIIIYGSYGEVIGNIITGDQFPDGIIFEGHSGVSYGAGSFNICKSNIIVSNGLGRGIYFRNYVGYEYSGVYKDVAEDNLIVVKNVGIFVGYVEETTVTKNIKLDNNHIWGDTTYNASLNFPAGIQTYATADSILISNNDIHGVRGAGIQSNSSNTVIKNNDVYNSGYDGIAVSTSGTLIYGNNLQGNGTLGTAFRMNGLLLATDADSNSVYNNYFKNNAEYGIRTWGGGSADWNVLKDNYFKGNGTGPIYLGTANNITRDNTGYVDIKNNSANLLNGSDSVLVTHGLSFTPSEGDILVCPIQSWGSATQFWVANYTSTTFTIWVDQNPGKNLLFTWLARRKLDRP